MPFFFFFFLANCILCEIEAIAISVACLCFETVNSFNQHSALDLSDHESGAGGLFWGFRFF